MFKELDTVELTHDIKKYDLKKGDFGAVVLVYKKGGPYAVEFVKPNGRTKALLTLTSSDIRPYTAKPNIYFDAPLVVNDAHTLFVETKINGNYKLTTEAEKSKKDTKKIEHPFAIL